MDSNWLTCRRPYRRRPARHCPVPEQPILNSSGQLRVEAIGLFLATASDILICPKQRYKFNILFVCKKK